MHYCIEKKQKRLTNHEERIWLELVELATDLVV